MANQVGERYKCDTCGSMLIVTQPGTGSLTCCDEPMTSLSGTPGAAGPAAPPPTPSG